MKRKEKMSEYIENEYFHLINSVNLFSHSSLARSHVSALVFDRHIKRKKKKKEKMNARHKYERNIHVFFLE